MEKGELKMENGKWEILDLLFYRQVKTGEKSKKQGFSLLTLAVNS